MAEMIVSTKQNDDLQVGCIGLTLVLTGASAAAASPAAAASARFRSYSCLALSLASWRARLSVLACASFLAFLPFG
jgi:hypothetical protein